MSELRVRKRTRLKGREARLFREELAEVLGGITLWGESAVVERGSLPDFDVWMVDGEAAAIALGGRPFLSVRGLLKYRPQRAWVTVDMGAVRFVHNGADIMAPGITDADRELQEGDWCWIRDERNLQPLAVGIAGASGIDMKVGQKGKVVRNVHHIGDKVWELDQPA